MRRIILLLLLLTLFPCPALGETGALRLAELDILSQRDPRLADKQYYYQDMLFRISGCKPASVTNALVALLGNADTDVPQLLTELQSGMIEAPWDQRSGIGMYLLPALLANPDDSAVVLKGLLRSVSSVISLDARTDNVTPSYLLSRHVSRANPHPLFIRELAPQKNWHWLIALAEELCQQGYPDARFVLCAASVGTDETDAPLRSGKGGHYVTIYFKAEEFYQEGTMYLLDSLPRALPGDAYGSSEHYPAQYPFTTKWRRDNFDQAYDAKRIIDPVLQFTLKPALLTELNSFSPKNSAARDKFLQKKAETLILYDRAYFMLYIP